MKNHVFKTATISLSTFATLLLAFSPAAFAWEINSFKNIECPNPGGNRIADFQDGWHWVVGFSQNMWGKDSVSDMGNQNFIQCFCPIPRDGQQSLKKGIQTDWRSVGNMSSDEQQQLINSGWQLRHDGTAFGLPSNDFLAKNFSFSCNIKNEENESNNVKATRMQSNTTHIFNNVHNRQESGDNSVSESTDGDISITTGDVSSTTEITNTVDSNRINSFGEHIKSIVHRMRVNVFGNGSFSNNSVEISSDQ